MKSSAVQINELRLRVPGLTPEQGRRLGEAVAQRLADIPPGGERSRRIPAIALRVRPGASGSIDRLADEIAAGIRRSLK